MSHPLLLLAVFWLGLLAVTWIRARVFSPTTPTPHLSSRWATASTLAAVAVLVTYAAIAVWYASSATYFDPAEPTITAVAWVFGRGLPLYPALDGPERYAHIYGPMLFIIQAAALELAGPAIPVSKAVGVVAVLVSLALGFQSLRRYSGTRVALAATAACALVYLAFANVTFWNRPDPLLILCVALALLATVARSGMSQVALLGASLGIAVNLKVTGPLYVLPVIAQLFAEKRFRLLAAAIVLAVALAVSPFLIQTVSLANFFDYLLLSARNGLDGGRVRQNLEWTIFLSAPVAAVLWSTASGARDRPLRAALGAAMLLTAVITAKPGGGPIHLVPFVPVLAYVLVRGSDPDSLIRASPPNGNRTPRSDPRPASPLIVAFLLTAALLALFRQRTFVTAVAGRELDAAVADVNRFADAHPGRRIAVGYAGWSHLSHARPAIVFRTNDYLLDAPAIQEHRLSGLQVPIATLMALERCRIEYMLIPRGAIGPFEVPNAYAPLGPDEVFPPEFLTVFHRSFRLTGSTTFYDVWQCQPHLGGAGPNQSSQ